MLMSANRTNLAQLTKQLILTAITIAMLLLLISLYRYFQPHSLIQTPSTVPSVIADDVHAHKFDIQGRLYYNFTSRHLEHFTADNHTDFINPTADLFEENQAMWHLSADNGTAFQGDKIVKLVGNVIVHQNKSAKNKPTTLKTNEIFIYPEEKTAINNVYTEVEQPGLTISSVGINADFTKGTVVLLSKAKGIYKQ